jgi:acetoacetyl-CoA synthetase
MSEVLWTPSSERVEHSQMWAFAQAASKRSGRDLSDYSALHRWSVDSPDAFWDLIWTFCEIIGDRSDVESRVGREENDPASVRAASGREFSETRFLTDARLNFAENLLRRSGAAEAIVFVGESGERRTLSYDDLRDEVARVATWLRARGLKAGDRIAGCLPNLPETIVAMLATTSLGGIWSSCSPDFGSDGVVDRFSQIEPTILLCTDVYHYNGRRIDTLARVPQILASLPSVECCVVIPYSPTGAIVSATTGESGVPAETMTLERIRSEVKSVDVLSWAEIRGRGDSLPLVFERLAMDHPLYILYSSGTTGKPKCIVHSAGGTLLQHLKEHRLHVDLREDERLFYFTTCGWMMWNWLVSGLGAGATLILFDGSPFHPDARRLWALASRERVDVFGVSAKFIDSASKAGVSPGREFDLTSIRAILSTGSPLSEDGFDYVYREVSSEVHLASISGGTDIVSCFVLGSPTLPVRRGEIQCAGLGMQVEVFDEEGNALVGTPGELVCTRPFPSMPIGFWNDPGGARYQAAYFERFPGVWCHGDWCVQTESGGFVIQGRSDAVLNPGGVRIGTAEIYSQVEAFDEIMEAIAIGQSWEGDVRVVLFVKMAAGSRLDDALCTALRRRIRSNASPRHVPAQIVEVEDIPRTRSGKITELAVRDVVHGRAVKNVEALANPEALEFFRGRPELEG